MFCRPEEDGKRGRYNRETEWYNGVIERDRRNSEDECGVGCKYRVK